MKKKIEKTNCVMICKKWRICPNRHFPNININKKIDCHLKI